MINSEAKWNSSDFLGPLVSGYILNVMCNMKTPFFFSFQISEPPGTWSKNTQCPLLRAKKTVLTTLSRDLNTLLKGDFGNQAQWVARSASVTLKEGREALWRGPLGWECTAVSGILLLSCSERTQSVFIWATLTGHTWAVTYVFNLY